MPIVSVHLSDLAHDEFKRIPKGQRSRVVSKGLESRSLDATTHVDGLSGHELADMVVELRSILDERQNHMIGLAKKIRDLEYERHAQGNFADAKGEEE